MMLRVVFTYQGPKHLLAPPAVILYVVLKLGIDRIDFALDNAGREDRCYEHVGEAI